MSRAMNLDGVRNFRDFGGYAAKKGRVKRAKLYRSAHLADATDEDVDMMAGLGVAVIVNLLRPTERQRFPSPRWRHFPVATIDNGDEIEAHEPWTDFIAQSDLSAASFRGHLERFYRSACFEPRYVDLFSRYFSALAQAEGAVLVHCAGGKDRTGILVALTHALMGVHRDDIIADFLLTNDPANIERVRPAFAAHIAETVGRMPDDDAMRVATCVEAKYLDEAFTAIEGGFGSLDAYFENGLGVDHARRAAIESRVLE
jgi:protein tyrosine/serine phosphatase